MSLPDSISANKIDLKLLIDECNGRVVFLECDGHFIDVLLSFLVMPVGAHVVRLTEKGSGLGCMDTLYDSVLDGNLFQTQDCKNMLLRPSYAYRSNCNDLLVKIDDQPICTYYVCPSFKKTGKECDGHYSTYMKDAYCKCGRLMTHTLAPCFSDNESAECKSGDAGVFIKEKKVKYIVSDDLDIFFSSTQAILLIFRQFNIKDFNQLQEKSVSAGSKEVLQLLKRSLVSKTPLTDTFLIGSNKIVIHAPEFSSGKVKFLCYKSGSSADESTTHMRMTLFLNKSTRQVLYAEADQDVIDFLFSFLTFPLGLLQNLDDDINLSFRCMRLLQFGALVLSLGKQLRTHEHFLMLIRPKLAAHVSCQNNDILQIVEGAPELSFEGLNYTARNPKLSNATTEKGGGFLKGRRRFMITDDLRIKEVDAFASVSIFRGSKIHVDGIEEMVVNIGKEQALLLLKASLVSKSPLNDIFGP